MLRMQQEDFKNVSISLTFLKYSFKIVGWNIGMTFCDYVTFLLSKISKEHIHTCNSSKEMPLTRLLSNTISNTTLKRYRPFDHYQGRC